MFKFLLKKYSLSIEILSLAICIGLVYKMVVLMLKTLETQTSKSGRWAFSLFFAAIRTPFKWCFWIFVLVLSLEFANSYFRLVRKFSTEQIQQSIIAIFATWVIIHFCNLVRKYAITHNSIHVDKTAAIALTQIGTVITVIVSTLTGLQILGVHIAGILAFGGFSGIAVGFASKDLLANFFGAIMIYMDKPFKVGDWISSLEKQIEGEVESIGWRQTKIMTFEKRPIYVPNSVFSTVIVENPSRMTHRKIEEKILIKHEDYDKVNIIAEEMQAFLANHSNIDNSQRVSVNLHAISPVALEMKIYCYTKVTDSVSFGKIKQEILVHASSIIEKHKAHLVETILEHGR